MALLKCSDCGNDVSSLAKACPNCGRPVISNDITPPTDIKSEIHPGSKPPRQSRRWLRGLFFALLLGSAGYYCVAIMQGSIPMAAVGAVLGVIAGFGLAGRKPAKLEKSDPTVSGLKPPPSNESHSVVGCLGILLAIAGLVAAYFAYEPDQFKAVVVYPNGQKSSHPARFKSMQHCDTWRKNELSMMSNQISNNPGVRYEGLHSFQCQRFCSSKFDCTLKSITNIF